MARYSYAKYGVSIYGELEANKVTYNSNIQAFQPYYNTVNLTWDNTINIAIPVPTGDELTHWKIVKTIGGAPDYPDNSFVVTGGAIQSFDVATASATIGSTRTIDTESYFPAGSEITYSFWVFNGKDWFFSGSANAIVVTDNNDTTLKLLNYLPGVWSNSTDGYGDVVGVPDEDTDIWKYITNFAFYYDRLRQETAAIDKVSDYRFYPNSMLPEAIRALGFEYEPTLGNNYHRALYKSGNIINSLKGSELGVKLYTSALTHLKNTIVRGSNLMHNYNDSSFEESTGNWAATKTIAITTTVLTDNLVTITTAAAHGFIEDDVVNISVATNNSIYGGTKIVYSAPTPTTFTYSISNVNIASASNTGTATSSYLDTSALFTAKKYATSVADLGLSSILTPPTPALLGQFTPRTEGYGLITSVGTTTGTAGFITLNSYNQVDTTTRTVPITPGEAYHFCGYIQGHTSNVSTTATAQASIVWFTKDGAFISETTLPTATTITTSWSYFDSSEAIEQIYAPLTAKYAGLKIYLKNTTNGDRYFVDMLDLCVFPGLVGEVSYVGGENVYEDARVSVVQVDGSRTNYVINPGFNNGVGSWSATGGTIIPTTEFANLGTNSCKYNSSVDEGYVYSDWFTFPSNKDFTASAYVKLPSGVKADISVQFSSPQSALDQTKITNGIFNTTPYSVTSDNSAVTFGTNFTRISVNGTSPEYTEDGGDPLVKIGIKIYGLGTTPKTAYIDSVLLEQGSELLPYFQGDGAITSSDVINDPFTAAEDLAWETRLRTNLVSNPSFEGGVTTGWTATTGVLTAQTTVSKFGTHSGRIVASGANSNVFTTLYYPILTDATPAMLPAGGEAIVGSAYVYGPAGDYTIEIDSGAYTATFSNLSANTWNRIHVVGFATKATVASPTNTVRVTYAGSTGTWYVDGVQFEFGHSPSPFVDPSDAATTAVANPKDAGKFTWTSWGLLSGSGKSYYWPRATAKFSRLATTLPNYVPLGSDIKVQRGTPTSPYSELPGSLVKSSSFENSLYGWSVREATTAFTREVSNSYPITSSNIGVLGGSWAKIINSTTAVTSFGIQQSGINVFGSTIYSLSCAAQITDAADYGVCSIKVEWFTSAGVTISSSTVDKTLNAAANVNAWTYVGGSVTSPNNAATATVTIYYAPTTRVAGNFIKLDRVLFKAL
jgi:hypothetical protein